MPFYDIPFKMNLYNFKYTFKYTNYFVLDLQLVEYQISHFYIPDIFGTFCLVEKFWTRNMLNCFVQCNKKANCVYLTFIENKCKLYNQNASYYTEKTFQPNLHIKKSIR